MATKVITVDDIDGYDGEDVAKRDFEVGGTRYTIDLGDANHKKLADVLDELAPFVEKAVEVKQATRSRRAPTEAVPKLRGYTNGDVRAWAQEQGIDVTSRGKIADETYELFIQAHPDARPES
jgi:hypothetical protein